MCTEKYGADDKIAKKGNYIEVSLRHKIFFIPCLLPAGSGSEYNRGKSGPPETVFYLLDVQRTSDVLVETG